MPRPMARGAACRLRKIDPESADRLHVNDIRRVIRALEFYHLTGRTMSDTWPSNR